MTGTACVVIAAVASAAASTPADFPFQPETVNHVEGSRIVLAAVRRGPWAAGYWYTGVGLVGVALLDVSLEDKIGYESFFFHNADRTSLEYAVDVSNWFLQHTAMGQGIKPEVKSVVARRQAVLSLIATNIEHRYLFDRDGAYGFAPEPDGARKEIRFLKTAIGEGNKVLSALSEAGVQDCVLADAMSIASVIVANDEARGLPVTRQATRIYKDALAAAIEKLRASRGGSHVLTTLGWELESRGLCTNDALGMFGSKESHAAIVKFVEADLAKIRKPMKKK